MFDPLYVMCSSRCVFCVFFLWSVQEFGDIYMYQPHTLAVSGLVFPPSPCTTSLFSASYDGTLRRADLVKGVFEEVKITCGSSPLLCIFYGLI